MQHAGPGIPDRHVEGADSDALFPVSTRFLPRHHNRPASKRVDICACLVG